MGRSDRRSIPQLEHDLVRDPRLGYEPPSPGEFVRCVEHGSPTPLERWHCHSEYELQLIVGARGHAFVGDYVGDFEPGHLVLTGPGLPHNWVSTDLPPDGLAVRSLVLQFSEQPLLEGMRVMKELEEVRPLLERARRGIEFFGLGDVVRERFYRLKASHGLERFAEFIALLCALKRCEDYRLLSSEQPVGLASEQSVINKIVEYIAEHYFEEISMPAVACVMNMSESSFSRYFSKATDSTFTAYVNCVRINKACQLLSHGDEQISSICYSVGFNNLANFNRRFRESKGVTPRDFRAQAARRLASS